MGGSPTTKVTMLLSWGWGELLDIWVIEIYVFSCHMILPDYVIEGSSWRPSGYFIFLLSFLVIGLVVVVMFLID